ncbi:hypothetical protein ABVK25_004859 [Lepraria finkii]|uniref:Uncharacterized protein n=1 Tax=Lepraria finkii TaxID=1340010 RepID=A0ABR4BC88_9LECA
MLAEKCDGELMPYVDIPGFHDPGIFWSGKGELLMMFNTHSHYACFGLWIIDLRTLYPPLSMPPQIIPNSHRNSLATQRIHVPLLKRIGYSSFPQVANPTSTTTSQTHEAGLAVVQLPSC